MRGPLWRAPRDLTRRHGVRSKASTGSGTLSVVSGSFYYETNARRAREMPLLQMPVGRTQGFPRVLPGQSCNGGISRARCSPLLAREKLHFHFRIDKNGARSGGYARGNDEAVETPRERVRDDPSPSENASELRIVRYGLGAYSCAAIILRSTYPHGSFLPFWLNAGILRARSLPMT